MARRCGFIRGWRILNPGHTPRKYNHGGRRGGKGRGPAVSVGANVWWRGGGPFERAWNNTGHLPDHPSCGAFAGRVGCGRRGCRPTETGYYDHRATRTNLAVRSRLVWPATAGRVPQVEGGLSPAHTALPRSRKNGGAGPKGDGARGTPLAHRGGGAARSVGRSGPGWIRQPTIDRRQAIVFDPPFHADPNKRNRTRLGHPGRRPVVNVCSIGVIAGPGRGRRWGVPLDENRSVRSLVGISSVLGKGTRHQCCGAGGPDEKNAKTAGGWRIVVAGGPSGRQRFFLAPRLGSSGSPIEL